MTSWWKNKEVWGGVLLAAMAAIYFYGSELGQVAQRAVAAVRFEAVPRQEVEEETNLGWGAAQEKTMPDEPSSVRLAEGRHCWQRQTILFVPCKTQDVSHRCQ